MQKLFGLQMIRTYNRRKKKENLINYNHQIALEQHINDHSSKHYFSFKFTFFKTQASSYRNCDKLKIIQCNHSNFAVYIYFFLRALVTFGY